MQQPNLLTTLYLTPAQIAPLLGEDYSTERARRMLRRSGAAVKRGGRWYTTLDLLRDAFPEVLQKVTLTLID